MAEDVNKQCGSRSGAGFEVNPENINKDGAPDKQWRWRDLFLAELELKAKKDEKMKKKQAIAKGLVEKAEEGDVQAFDRIADRMEGKAPQSIGTIDPDGKFEKQNIVLEFVKSPHDEANNTDT